MNPRFQKFSQPSAAGIRLLVCIPFLSAGTSLAQYESQPLRAQLAAEPFFNTDLGREGHRFANEPINRYNLYDFYQRQAEYHLEQGKVPDLLLPFPGLQGGRQGHWGNSNEPIYSAVTDREVEPEHYRLVERRNGQFLTLAANADGGGKAVALLDPATGAMSKVVADARMVTPIAAFSYKVDRFGFDMGLSGIDYFMSAGPEWLDAAGPARVSTSGHYVHGASVVFRRDVAGVGLLDMPGAEFAGETLVYSRAFEWLGAAPGLTFVLPSPAAAFAAGEKKVEEARPNKTTLRISVTGAEYRVIHEIRSAGQATMVRDGDSIRVSLPASKAGDRVRISSWIEKADAPASIPTLEVPTLSPLTKGGPIFYEKTVTVKGVLDADPAAKGSGYAIDDIPVPVKNPYGTPMTTSGLAFDAKGSAYIATMVGDVWKVTGLEGDLGAVKWNRFASGIPNPLGLEMVGDVLYVTAVGKIMKLHDINRDGEADYYERFTADPLNLGGMGSENQNLERDAAGNFYVCGVAGIIRISPDGSKMELVGGGARNPFGLAVRADGLALSDSSEGSPLNGTCTIYESNNPENEKSVSKNKRILYLPRGVDNSPGSRIFLDNPKFGPLGKSIFGVSFGSGRVYSILRDPNEGTPQAALFPLPMEISSGAMRLEENPVTKEIFVVGMDGWGDFAVTEGSLNRIRYTGEDCLVPTGWKAYRNGISVTFNEPLDPATVAPELLFLQQWNYVDYQHVYGSPEFSVRQPGQIGHDHVKIGSVNLSADGKTLFVEAQDILPAMCTHLYGNLASTSGAKLKLNLYATLNQLNGNHPSAKANPGGKPLDLISPDEPGTLDTYSTLMNFFDKRAGRDPSTREVGAEVAYQREDLDYKWIKEHVIDKQCILCHGAGMPHDYSTYEGLKKKIDPVQPEKSALLGMMKTGSMPPYPLPSVAPGMQDALLQWIMDGAREHAANEPLGEMIPVKGEVTVSGEWAGREKELSRRHLVDGDFATLWATPDGTRSGWFEVDLGEAQEVSAILLDDSPFGRTRGYDIKVKQGDEWKVIASGVTIGARNAIRFDKVKAQKFRVEIRNATDVPVISEVQFFK